MPVETYILQIYRPKGVPPHRMKEYIAEAIDRHSKGGDPDDPLWNTRVIRRDKKEDRRESNE